MENTLQDTQMDPVEKVFSSTDLLLAIHRQLPTHFDQSRFMLVNKACRDAHRKQHTGWFVERIGRVYPGLQLPQQHDLVMNLFWKCVKAFGLIGNYRSLVLMELERIPRTGIPRKTSEIFGSLDKITTRIGYVVPSEKKRPPFGAPDYLHFRGMNLMLSVRDWNAYVRWNRNIVRFLESPCFNHLIVNDLFFTMQEALMPPDEYLEDGEFSYFICEGCDTRVENRSKIESPKHKEICFLKAIQNKIVVTRDVQEIVEDKDIKRKHLCAIIGSYFEPENLNIYSKRKDLVEYIIGEISNVKVSVNVESNKYAGSRCWPKRCDRREWVLNMIPPNKRSYTWNSTKESEYRERKNKQL